MKKKRTTRRYKKTPVKSRTRRVRKKKTRRRRVKRHSSGNRGLKGGSSQSNRGLWAEGVEADEAAREAAEKVKRDNEKAQRQATVEASLLTNVKNRNSEEVRRIIDEEKNTLQAETEEEHTKSKISALYTFTQDRGDVGDEAIAEWTKFVANDENADLGSWLEIPPEAEAVLGELITHITIKNPQKADRENVEEARTYMIHALSEFRNVVHARRAAHEKDISRIINQRDVSGKTLLHMAVPYGGRGEPPKFDSKGNLELDNRAQVLKVLIENPGVVDEKDNNGNTPLILAAGWLPNTLPCVEVLLRNGANLQATVNPVPHVDNRAAAEKKAGDKQREIRAARDRGAKDEDVSKMENELRTLQDDIEKANQRVDVRIHPHDMKQGTDEKTAISLILEYVDLQSRKKGKTAWETAKIIIDYISKMLRENK